MNKEVIKQLTANDPYLASKLYCRGFLFTDDHTIDRNLYPFYDGWNVRRVGRYELYTHPLLTVNVIESGGIVIGILGHAYDPIDGEIDEQSILRRLADHYSEKEKYNDTLNQLTGVYTLFTAVGDTLTVLNDPVSLSPVFYSAGQKNHYVASHSLLINDFLDAEEDPYVTRLRNQRTFYYFGNQLPGDITRFKEIKLLIPNHQLTLDQSGEEIIRYYYPRFLKLSREEITDKLTKLLKGTMRLIAEKWKRPAISLTGGCDSKTTLAAACDEYEKYRYFSYDSQPNELPDAEAAKAICSALGLPHIYYHIPYEDSAFENIEGVRAVLLWNGGDVRANNPNDVRKRCYLDQKDDFDVEVKSWASEVGRARYSKRYGNVSFGKYPTARKCSTFYKFLLGRRIVRDTDKVFNDYLERFYKPSDINPIPWQDQFYWEWHWPSRDGITLKCEHNFSDEITVPYNNRRILELLLSMPEEDRINDTVYTAVRARLDPRIDAATDAIVDVNHSKKRLVAERAYYRVNRILR